MGLIDEVQILFESLGEHEGEGVREALVENPVNAHLASIVVGACENGIAHV